MRRLPSKNPAKTSKAALPSFKNPPLNEVVCGLRFDPLQELKIPHIGLFWDRIRDEFPVVQHSAPLSNDDGSIFVDDNSGAPLPRVWLINGTDDQLVQFQVDRFYFNWRRRQNAYPRYQAIVETFEKQYEKLVRFVDEHKLGKVTPTELELTYLNKIEAPDRPEDVFRDFIWQQSEHSFLPAPSRTVWQLRFSLPDNNGTMTVKLGRGIKVSDNQPILMLDLSVKGAAQDRSPQGIREWFDLAHQWIVKGFEDMTTRQAHKLWQKEHA